MYWRTQDLNSRWSSLTNEHEFDARAATTAHSNLPGIGGFSGTDVLSPSNLDVSTWTSAPSLRLDNSMLVSVVAPSMKSFIMTIFLSACRLLSAFALIHGSVLISNAPLVLVRQLDAAFELKILIEAPKSARSSLWTWTNPTEHYPWLWKCC